MIHPLGIGINRRINIGNPRTPNQRWSGRDPRLFITGIRRDEGAVRAALTYGWSNGQTEGQINRLKFIKRQMFGRAKFDLLKARVLHAG